MRMTSPGRPEQQSPEKKKPGKGAKTVGLIAAGLVGLCCIGGIIATANGNSGSTSTTDTKATPTSAAQAAAPAGPSDNEVRAAALAYKACPAKQHDTLQDMLGMTFTVAQDKPTGSRVVSRDANHARISAGYIENGQNMETMFDYDLATHQVTGADDLAGKVLDTLKAEC